MKISACTFIRNAVRFDYPIVESINSILPIIDEYVVLVGKSDDDTFALIQSINSEKIRIIESEWDESLNTNGEVLADETNKALTQISKKADWIFYLQGDEVVHEKDQTKILRSCQENISNHDVEGLLFSFIHFYGDYDHYGDSRKWYRNEIRIIRNNEKIRSYKDAQGFRIDGRKLKVKKLDADIYHYGWVKEPIIQLKRIKNSQIYWEKDQWGLTNLDSLEFDYNRMPYLVKFEGSHPSVMDKRLKSKAWEFEYNPKHTKASFRRSLLHFIEKFFGWRIGAYKNYRII